MNVPRFRKTRALALLALAMVSTPKASQADTVLFWGTPGQAAVAQMMLDLKSALADLPKALATKNEFEGQIWRARQRVTQACHSKQRDLQAEAEFVHLLDQKDFYYLPFYMNQLGLRGPASAVQALLGGKLDGGIRPEAEQTFNAWAFAMKAALLKSVSGDQAATERAVQETEPVYIRYIIARNEAEINAITGGRAEFMVPDPTPRQFADTYADEVLKPALEAGRPWNGPPLTPQSIEELRQAVFAYENIKLDPEKIAKSLKGYNNDVVEAFLRNAKKAESDPPTYQARLEQAYSDAFVADMARKGTPNMPPPGREAQLDRMKYASDPAAVERLKQLDPRYQYVQFRPGIKKLVGPKVDWCTGQEIK